MARQILVKQTNWASGELSPALKGRTDIDKYYNGAETFLNWLPVVQGGARRAPGTRYVDNPVVVSRLLRYEASTEALFLVVLQDRRVSIYWNDVLHQTLTAPWLVTEIFAVDVTQALDTMVLCHEDHPPHRLIRSSSNIFSLEDLTDTANDLYLENVPTEPVALRWFKDLYRTVGDVIRPTSGKENGFYYTCTQDGLSGSAEPAWSTTLGGSTTDGGAKWETTGNIADIEVWNTTRGWPRCCTFFEDRLVFAGAKSFPNRLWMSRSGKYFNFDMGSGFEDDGVARELLENKLASIQWVRAGRNLVLGTTNGEWATIQTDPVTPSNCNLRAQTGIGSARVPPVDVDGAVLHLTANRNQLRELVFSDIEQAYATRSLSVLAPAAVNQAVQLASVASVSYDDANLVFIANNGSGELGILSLLRDQEFVAWCRRSFAGDVESVAVLGTTVYLVVSYAFGPGVYEDDVYEAGVYEADGAASVRLLVKWDDDAKTDFGQRQVQAVATTTWSGFEYLAGQEVQVVADGVYIGVHTVGDDGVVTLAEAANIVEIGVAIPTPTIKPMPAAFNSVNGDISHFLKRLIEVYVEVQDTQALQIDGKNLTFRQATDVPGSAITPFSGVLRRVRMGWDREASCVFTAPDPLAATILSITRKVGY